MADTYQVDGYCTNCDYSGKITIKKGARIPLPFKRGDKFGWRPMQWSQGAPVECPKCGNFTCYGSG